MSKARYDTVSSVPAIIDDIRTAPNRSETYHDEPDRENVVGGVELIMHFLFALIIGWGMYWSVEKIGWGMVVAVAYFLPATMFRVLAKTGTLKSWLRSILDYKLEARRIDTLADLADRHFDLLEAEARHRAPLPIAQTPHEAPAQNYVAPYRPEAIDEAVAYAESLYDASGYIDPRKVHASGRDKARIKGQVIGSKRGGGSQAAQQYLIDRGFLGVGRGGYWVNLKRFPTCVEVARLRR